MPATNQATDDQLAKILWDYNRMEMPLEKADIILALGSNDIRVAERAAELYLRGYAPLVVFSGGLGALTRDIFTKPEAEVFAGVALAMGVPGENILLEDRSTNTGENIRFTRTLLGEQGITPQVIILVQKPYMLRRAYATFRQEWPEMELIVTGPQISYEAYPTQTIPKELMINVMVGDTQRIKLYPEKGFQIPQDIPEDVWSAFEELVKRGYKRRLIA